MAIARTEVSEERTASIIRVKRINVRATWRHIPEDAILYLLNNTQKPIPHFTGDTLYLHYKAHPINAVLEDDGC
jgi:hypothetical protein